MPPFSSLLTSAPASLALVFVTSCATPNPPAGGSSSDPEQPDPAETPKREREPSKPEPKGDPLADAFVEAHNRHRAEVSPAADPPLPPVQWSDELAATARAWAKRCVFEHHQGDFGENLGARTDQADPADMVASWAAEGQNFDHRKNRCKPGEVCGHYTQLVWRGSTSIGCAVERCSGGGPFGGGEWFLYVCDYAPPGNWKGERPY